METEDLKIKQHYESISDDELIHISINSNLTPTAKQYLDSELSRRGYSEEVLQQEQQQIIEQRKRNVNAANEYLRKRYRGRVWVMRFLYISAFGTVLRGVYFYLFPVIPGPLDPKGPDLAQLFIGGPAMFLFACVLTLLYRVKFKDLVPKIW